MNKILIIIVIGLLFSARAIQAAVMSSTNFQIFSDEVSVGGDLSNSTNFRITDTFNVGAEGTTNMSASFADGAGFQRLQPDEVAGVLSVTFSKNTINLGTLSTGGISSDNQILTVTTNAATGYTTTIQSDGELRVGNNSLPRVGGGTITAGVAAYGVETSGGNGQLTAISPISTTAQTIAATAAPVTSISTTITYKATISGSTAPGDYSQLVTFTTTANF